MTIRDRKELKQTAGRRLQAAAYPAKKLILIHSGVTLGLSLLVELIAYWLDTQIGVHTGLAGVQTRTILETASNVLNLLYSLLLPFWSIGIVYSALRVGRGHSAYPHTLAEGFRRFGPVLRLRLMELLIYSILVFIAMYASGILFTFTPAGAEFAQQLEGLFLSGQLTDYTQALESLSPEMIADLYKTVLPIFAVLAVAMLVPAYYRLRMASYVVMDTEGAGAWKSIRTSGRILKRKGFRLFLLDLSYWWYYLLIAVAMLPVYADLLLPLMGIDLPMEAEHMMLAGYGIYAVLRLLLDVAVQPRRMTVYALAYDAMREEYAAAQLPETAEKTQEG